MFRSFPGRRSAVGILSVFVLTLIAVADDTKSAEKVALDKKVMAEIKNHSEIMKNLAYLSDVIGPRLTGSANLERANRWTAAKMKEYGLENVKLEPWEIPVGWERGTASMKLILPTEKKLTVASAGWSPGTRGRITGEVVYVSARTKADLDKYRGKLRNAIVMSSPPSTTIRSIKDAAAGGSGIGGGRRGNPDAAKQPEKKDEKKEEKKDSPPAGEKKDEKPAKQEEPMAASAQPPAGGRGGRFGDDYFSFQNELREFFVNEGVAATLTDANKPHGLLVTTGGWGRGDRGSQNEGIARLFMAHEDYALLYRHVTAKMTTVCEIEVTNKFIPGPITVYNTVGEVRGSEKPDEFVVLGAHLDSWDLATGTTDNGTGSSVVLESARTIAKLAKEGYKPKRTIRFVLFSGEEQGLHGSKKYVEKHGDEMAKTSAAMVHDTGTGKVLGFGTLGRENTLKVLNGELDSLKEIGFERLHIGGMRGGTDHYSFHTEGVPGFACDQDGDEYYFTHHTQSDTFDKAKEPNLIQGAQVMSVTAMRVANLPELLPENTYAQKQKEKAEREKKAKEKKQD